MRIPRTFVDASLAAGERVRLPDDVAHHWRKVLRLADGASVRLFNGDRGDWRGRLVAVGKRGAEVAVDAFEPRAGESPLHVTLVQGISRGQRMDFTIEKAVELGVERIVPVVMARSHGAPRGERIQRKAGHWRGVVLAAASQAGRTRLPELAEQRSLRDWLEREEATGAERVMLDPDGDVTGAALAPDDAVVVMAGPEGGFTPAERDAARAAGFRGLAMGPRTLRTETAAVAALAIVGSRCGDLG